MGHTFIDKDAFNKLHCLIALTSTFAVVCRMIGIVNEESFRAFHAHLEKVKYQPKYIPDHL